MKFFTIANLCSALRALAVISMSFLLPYQWAEQNQSQYTIWSGAITLILLLDAVRLYLFNKQIKFILVAQVLAAIPFELIYGPLFLIRLIFIPIWLMKGNVRKQIYAHYLIPSPFERALVSTVGIVILAHWVSCGWVLISEVRMPNHFEQYVDALYWSVVTMASVGYGDITPHTVLQKFYAIAVIFLGVGIYGYIIGNVTALLSSLDRAKEKHRENISEMVSWLNYRGVPKSLQRRVVEHMHLLWEKRLTLDDSVVLKQLPPSLRAQLAVTLYSDLLKRVPLLKNAPPLFLSELATRLKPLVLQPLEFVFEKGQTGNEIYFISNGQVQVFDPMGTGVIATLDAGSFFGEIALLLNEPRTATVQTTMLCELYALNSKDFTATLALFPEFSKEVHLEAERRKKALK